MTSRTTAIICMKNPDIEVLDLVVRRLRQQEEVQRIIFVISEKGGILPFIEWSESNLWHGDSIIFEAVSLAYARKLGIQHSTTEMISFVDHDVLIPSGFFKKCLQYLEKYPQIGALNGRSTDTEWPKYGIEDERRQFYKLERGLCTANLIRRALIQDWNPPRNLEALEDFHLTQHIKDKGKLWLQIPDRVLHMSFGEDMAKRWLWNAAGIRLIQQLGMGHKLPLSYQAPTTLHFLFWRVVRFFTTPLYYMRYGKNAKAMVYHIRFQFYLLKGYLQASKYLESRRTGNERLAAR